MKDAGYEIRDEQFCCLAGCVSSILSIILIVQTLEE